MMLTFLTQLIEMHFTTFCNMVKKKLPFESCQFNMFNFYLNNIVTDKHLFRLITFRTGKY